MQAPDSLSITGKKWQFTQQPGAQVIGWAQQCGLPLLLGQILSGRQLGLASATDLAAFLKPNLQALPDPHLLPDVEKAATILATALQDHKKIAIFGDYDVDGSCATAVLQRYLKALGITPLFYIPDRMTEGYGPTPIAMQKLKAQGAELLLTVDCGSVAFAALEEAEKLGLQVIVTDHHQMQATLPPCAALINPHRLDAPEIFTMLSGGGVAFYLVLALNRTLRALGYFKDSIKEPDVRYLLDLVALSSVADVMPLVGINRIFVERGLKILEHTQNIGLQALLDIAGATDGPLTPYTLGFVLGPRINAGGRVGSSNLAVDILTAEDISSAQGLAFKLQELNQKRQEIEAQVQAEAIIQVEKQPQPLPPALVVWGQNWHPGVVGIVAARLKERYYRPTFVLGQDELGQWKGSARSIPGVDVGKAMQQCRSVVESGGGHAMAAGATVAPDKIEAFKAAFVEAVQSQTNTQEDVWQPSLRIDASLAISAATPELVEQVNALAPFGPKNPEPRFVLPGVRVAYCKPVGAQQNHLKLTLEGRGGEKLDAIAFKAMESDLGPFLSAKNPQISIVGSLKVDTWGGRSRTQLMVDDACQGAWQPNA
jgi:single-stranded-DNA-specific exonuclease